MSESSDKFDRKADPIPDSDDTSPEEHVLLELCRELGLLAGRRLATLEMTDVSNDPRASTRQASITAGTERRCRTEFIERQQDSTLQSP